MSTSSEVLLVFVFEYCTVRPHAIRRRFIVLIGLMVLREPSTLIFFFTSHMALVSRRLRSLLLT